MVVLLLVCCVELVTSWDVQHVISRWFLSMTVSGISAVTVSSFETMCLTWTNWKQILSESQVITSTFPLCGLAVKWNLRDGTQCLLELLHCWNTAVPLSLVYFTSDCSANTWVFRTQNVYREALYTLVVLDELMLSVNINLVLNMSSLVAHGKCQRRIVGNGISELNLLSNQGATDQIIILNTRSHIDSVQEVMATVSCMLSNSVACTHSTIVSLMASDGAPADGNRQWKAF